MNFATPPEFAVVYGEDFLENAAAVHLMTFIVWLLDDQPAEFTRRANGFLARVEWRPKPGTLPDRVSTGWRTSTISGASGACSRS